MQLYRTTLTVEKVDKCTFLKNRYKYVYPAISLVNCAFVNAGELLEIRCSIQLSYEPEASFLLRFPGFSGSCNPVSGW
jgi:hypothetical protein